MHQADWEGRLPTNNPIRIAFEDSGQHLAAKQNLSGSTVPSLTLRRQLGLSLVVWQRETT
jgi:hypothetical protein